MVYLYVGFEGRMAVSKTLKAAPGGTNAWATLTMDNPPRLTACVALCGQSVFFAVTFCVAWRT